MKYSNVIIWVGVNTILTTTIQLNFTYGIETNNSSPTPHVRCGDTLFFPSHPPHLRMPSSHTLSPTSPPARSSSAHPPTAALTYSVNTRLGGFRLCLSHTLRLTSGFCCGQHPETWTMERTCSASMMLWYGMGVKCPLSLGTQVLSQTLECTSDTGSAEVTGRGY